MTDLCRCVDISIGSFAHTVLMQDPFTEKLVGIDVCIATEIAELWHQGIRTMASCCGHGKYPPSVSVHVDQDERMPGLGYVLDVERNSYPARSTHAPLIWLLPASLTDSPDMAMEDR